jgi:hypothetical protein
LLSNRLSGAAFILLDSRAQDMSIMFTWSAVSNSGNVNDGNDALVLRDGLIQYHSTRFNVG